MYKVIYNDDSWIDAKAICYDKDGNIFGFLRINDVFNNLDKVKCIEELTPHKIYPPAPAPAEFAPEPTKQRPFRIGDTVKVVSLDNSFIDVNEAEKIGDVPKVGHIGTITKIRNTLWVYIDESVFYYSILDLQHVD